MTIAYSNQFQPWQRGTNLTKEYYFQDYKDLVCDIESMFHIDKREHGLIDNDPFAPGINVTNHDIIGCNEYDDDMHHVDLILRGK